MPSPELVPLICAGLIASFLTFAGIELALGWIGDGARADENPRD